MRKSILGVLILGSLSVAALAWAAAPAATDTELDRIIRQANATKKLTVAPVIDDLPFLRRVTVDLIGRIPTESEIKEFLALPAASRRNQVIEKLLADPQFADRWTVFFGDLLRIRNNQPGGAALTAFVHKAIEVGLPYDAICKQLIAANGRAGKTPEVGFILGDDADPLALAGVTSQVFMGIRIACAQCHDHPFDVWTRKEFYGLAAFFGRTRRVESKLTNAIYTTETSGTSILWPPEDMAKGGPREAMAPKFPFELADSDGPRQPIARLTALREAQAARAQGNIKGPSLDDLLAAAGERLNKDNLGKARDAEIDVAGEAKMAARNLRVQDDIYKSSEFRRQLADMVTDPRNPYFSRSLMTRLWKALVGQGFVEPVDDFSESNEVLHPAALDYLADEFVASGFDLRTAVRLITTSKTYQRGHVVAGDLEREESEKNFVATPVRRMVSESLFDSIVLAGHLFELKHPAGVNNKTIVEIVREAVNAPGQVASIKPKTAAAGQMMAMSGQAMAAAAGGYDLESAIEVNFDAVLKKAKDAPEVEQMTAVSNEELEAMQMVETRRTKYIERKVETVIDDNPKFASAMRMAAPATPSHFLRIFGQTGRDALGEAREHNPSMRQALMMLNGRVTHEASRVGQLEPIYPLLVGPNANAAEAIRMAYREILTREPSQEELAEARSLLGDSDAMVEGMADLRWVLLNSHEFRYIP